METLKGPIYFLKFMALGGLLTRTGGSGTDVSYATPDEFKKNWRSLVIRSRQQTEEVGSRNFSVLE